MRKLTIIAGIALAAITGAACTVPMPPPIPADHAWVIDCPVGRFCAAGEVSK